MGPEVIVLTPQQVQELINNTWKKAEQATKTALSEEYIPVSEAAKILGEHRKTTYDRIDAGEFEHVKKEDKGVVKLLRSEVIQLFNKKVNK